MAETLTDRLTRISNELTNEAARHSGSARRKLLDAGRILMIAKRQGWITRESRTRADGLAEWGVDLLVEAIMMRADRSEDVQR